MAGLARVVGPAGQELAPIADAFVSGEFVLSPVQRWFLERGVAEPGWFSQSVVLEALPGAEEEVWQHAVDAVLDAHPALRSRFAQNEDGAWSGTVVEHEDGHVLTWIDVPAGLSDKAAWEWTRAWARDEAETGFDLASGPLVRVVAFDRGEAASQVIWIAAHHLVIDAVSWPALIDDLTRRDA